MSRIPVPRITLHDENCDEVEVITCELLLNRNLRHERDHEHRHEGYRIRIFLQLHLTRPETIITGSYQEKQDNREIARY